MNDYVLPMRRFRTIYLRRCVSATLTFEKCGKSLSNWVVVQSTGYSENMPPAHGTSMLIWTAQTTKKLSGSSTRYLTQPMRIGIRGESGLTPLAGHQRCHHRRKKLHQQIHCTTHRFLALTVQSYI